MLGSVVSLAALFATASAGTPGSHIRAASNAKRAAHAVPSAVTLTASDYAFTGMPAEVAAGWVTVRMVNHGRELHMFATMNVPHGYTSSQIVDSLLRGGSLPNDTNEWGGPNAVAPGDTGTVTIFLPPGDYVIGCFVQSADSKTHFVKGMIGSVHATQTTAGARAPTSAHDVTLSSYAIAMTGPPIHAGANTLHVHNAAKERHDLVVLRVAPGHSVDDALAWFTNPPTGPATATAVAGTTGIASGRDVYVSGNFTPGTYVLVCWMYTKGKVHHQLGMKHVFTVAS